MADRRTDDPEGADYRPARDGWQRASLFASRNWLGALVLILVIVSAAGTIKLLNDQGISQRELIYDNRLASQQGCARANPGRVAGVQAALDQAEGNRARAEAWRSIEDIGLPPAFDAFLAGQIKANENEAEAAIRYANILILAQQAVAKDPDAKNRADRVAVDCKAVFPLPDERGDELPEPTKP